MEMEKISRLCPSCSCEILYKSKYAFTAAELKNSKCAKCRGKGIKKTFKPGKLSVFQKEFWIKKGMSEEDAIKKVSSIQSKSSSKKTKEMRSKIANETSPYKIDTWLKRGLSQEDAEFEVKSRRKCNNEYWTKRGLTQEEASRKVSEFQSSSSKNPKGKDVLPTQIGYWLKKMDGNREEAEKKHKERQATFTLDKCILRWGEEIGRKKWIDRQKKWISKYRKKSYSFVSQELFWKIQEKRNFQNSEIAFATFDNGSKTIDIKTNNEAKLFLDNRLVLPDFIHFPSKKIIEFDGVYYHKNTPENKKRERQRDEDLKRNGYTVLHVNEKQYKNYPEQTLNKCLEFLQNAH